MVRQKRASKMRIPVKSGEAGFEKVESKFQEWQKRKGKLNHLDKGKF